MTTHHDQAPELSDAGLIADVDRWLRPLRSVRPSAGLFARAAARHAQVHQVRAKRRRWALAAASVLGSLPIAGLVVTLLTGGLQLGAILSGLVDLLVGVQTLLVVLGSVPGLLPVIGIALLVFGVLGSTAVVGSMQPPANQALPA